MLKIGEFSKLSRVSVRMLRHYDDIDLLKPVKIDEITGYRYYIIEQLVQCNRITSLKEMGFTLNDIKAILIIYDNSTKLEEYLHAQKDYLTYLAENSPTSIGGEMNRLFSWSYYCYIV